MALIEKGPGFAGSLRDFPSHFGVKPLSAAVVAAIFGCSGPALVVIGAAEAGGLTQGQTVAWLFGIYFFGGIISLIMALYYKMPVVGAYSIPGAALIAGSMANFSFDQMVGSFIMAGVLVLLLGLSGLVGRVMRWLPVPIVMAMIAGAMIRFGIGTVDAATKLPVIVGAAIAAYFLSMRFVRAVPPVLSALVVGLAITWATGSFAAGNAALGFVTPEFTAPAFSIGAFLAIALPLAVLVIGAENAQATGVLMAEGYNPPVNAMTIISGIGGVVAGLVGAHNANIAGPMTAICSSEQAGEDKAGRYTAAVTNGILFGSFGLFAAIAVPLILRLPSPLIMAVAGLAMIGVLISSLQEAFGATRGYQIGAFTALVVAMSNVSLLNISAPFWALLAGVVVSLIADEEVPPRKSGAQTT